MGPEFRPRVMKLIDIHLNKLQIHISLQANLHSFINMLMSLLSYKSVVQVFGAYKSVNKFYVVIVPVFINCHTLPQNNET